MPSASYDNISDHRARYDNLVAHRKIDDAIKYFVGDSDPIWTGYTEIESIRKYVSLSGKDVVGIGCGIGRLTCHMKHEEIRSYLGIDIIPEIMAHAKAFVPDDHRFSFAVGCDCKIPALDGSFDLVAAFPVITHLLDEECFDYLREARRCLRTGGFAIFSFLDFASDVHRACFFEHAKNHRGGHGDLLKFTTKEVLLYMADEVGFSDVHFLEGTDIIPSSGQRSVLMDSLETPPSVIMGQSVRVAIA